MLEKIDRFTKYKSSLVGRTLAVQLPAKCKVPGQSHIPRRSGRKLTLALGSLAFTTSPLRRVAETRTPSCPKRDARAYVRRSRLSFSFRRQRRTIFSCRNSGIRSIDQARTRLVQGKRMIGSNELVLNLRSNSHGEVVQ